MGDCAAIPCKGRLHIATRAFASLGEVAVSRFLLEAFEQCLVEALRLLNLR